MDTSKNNRVLSVSELTHSIKTMLEMQYRFVHIQGEVSNLRVPFSGHSYFTLKDSGAQIKAVLFKGQQKFLQQKIKEGQSIICHGRISVYEPRGEYQIIVDTVDFSGTGNLQLQFEILKQKLADEGLFLKEKKKNIPLLPEHIALITSPTGAAVYDFLKIADKRKYFGNISIIPVAVQGSKAADEITRAIAIANNESSAEIIFLLRGGGSLEDLWAFNEEKTARAVFSSALPVVTGIGHETDCTIADMCADLHTHTPTAAAEAVIPDCKRLKNEITSQKIKLSQAITASLSKNEKAVQGLVRVIGDLDLYLANLSLRVDHRISELAASIQYALAKASAKLESASSRLSNQTPAMRLIVQQQKIDFLKKELVSKINRLLERKQESFYKQAAILDSVSPLNVLSRGYSIAKRSDGKVVSDSAQVTQGDVIDLRLHRGQLVCEVVDIRKGDLKNQ